MTQLTTLDLIQQSLFKIFTFVIIIEGNLYQVINKVEVMLLEVTIRLVVVYIIEEL